MSRCKTLYLGIDLAKKWRNNTNVTHFPIIKIIPRFIEPIDIRRYTHLIFTSKSTVRIFFDLKHLITNQIIIAVGESTARLLKENDSPATYTATDETSEGIIAILEKLKLDEAHILWPHSSLSRPIIRNYLQSRNIRFDEIILYDTVPEIPAEMPNLDWFDEIVFTSPSTVDAFIHLFGSLPRNKKLTSIGPITDQHLHKKLALPT